MFCTGRSPFQNIFPSGHLHHVVGFHLAFGNHEFDFGPDVLADFIAGSVRPGTLFLGANLDFSGEPRLQDLMDRGRIGAVRVVRKRGHEIGIIGAITPALEFISSPRNVIVNEVLGPAWYVPFNMGILLVALYFLSVHLGEGLRLQILAGHIVTASKRFYGISEFCYYALADGGVELDMVCNISKVLSGDWDYVRADIEAVVAVTHAARQKVKVIFENCYLEDEHRIRLCEICGDIGADWVKTSTGYGTGATFVA